MGETQGDRVPTMPAIVSGLVVITLVMLGMMMTQCSETSDMSRRLRELEVSTVRSDMQQWNLEEKVKKLEDTND